MKKILIYGLIAGLIIALIVFLYVFRKADTGGISKKPDYIMNSDSLYSFYSTNEEKANNTILGKIIQVKGEVGEISNDTSGIKITFFSSDGVNGIICTMGDDQSKKTEKVKKGDSAEIKGVCAGFNSDVYLNSCSIIK